MSKAHKINELKQLLNKPEPNYDKIYYRVDGGKVLHCELPTSGRGNSFEFADLETVHNYLSLVADGGVLHILVDGVLKEWKRAPSNENIYINRKIVRSLP